MTVATDLLAPLQAALREGPRVVPHGGGTKPALSTPPDGAMALDVSGLSGIVEYDPAELTLTALAGTPVAEVQAALAEHDQVLPFDPPLGAAGATLGGVVAAGTSGPAAYRHGGVRDFLVGARFLDGTGRLVTGGGKVVKNAAGFDLPKLMVGSLGRLGILVQLSFKVFPRPQATATLQLDLGALEPALAAVMRLGRSPFDVEALELEPPGVLRARLAGAPEGLPRRLERLEAWLAAGPGVRLEGEEEARAWEAAAELSWVPRGHVLVKAGLTPRRIPRLEAALDAAGAVRRYGTGGNLGWLAWPADRPLADLSAALSEVEAAGLRLTGPPGHVLLGRVRRGAFAQRVRSALDPHGRFLEV
jgi:glycolate oxidase FAD binding subunit